MIGFRSVRELLGLSIAVGLCAASTLSASASAPPKPTGTENTKSPGAAAPTAAAPVGSKPAKTGHPGAGMAPVAFFVSLSTSAEIIAPGGTIHLVATSNQDVGPTPYYIEIYEEISGSLVSACASGTTCSADATQGSPTYERYRAVIAPYSPTNPDPSTIQASTIESFVEWMTVSLASSNGASHVPGETVTLYASLSYPGLVWPYHYHLEILDLTDRTLVAECNGGTQCVTSVTPDGSAVRSYQVYVSRDDRSVPPGDVAVSSPVLTVSWLTVSISGSRNGSYLTVTASTGVDVGPSPFYIEIFEYNGGHPIEVAICGSGSTCSTSNMYRPASDFYDAVVATYTTVWPPPPDLRGSTWFQQF